MNLRFRINFGNKSFGGFCRDSTENVDEQHDKKERHCQCQCCTKPTVEHSLGMLCVYGGKKKKKMSSNKRSDGMWYVSVHTYLYSG